MIVKFSTYVNAMLDYKCMQRIHSILQSNYFECDIHTIIILSYRKSVLKYLE